MAQDSILFLMFLSKLMDVKAPSKMDMTSMHTPVRKEDIAVFVGSIFRRVFLHSALCKGLNKNPPQNNPQGRCETAVSHQKKSLFSVLTRNK